MTQTADASQIRHAQQLAALPESEAWGLLGPIAAQLPASWRTLTTFDDGAMLAHRDGRRVILSVAREQDGKRWMHLSISRPDRLPSYGDLCDAKRVFVGADRKAIQVFAPEAEHVNLHAGASCGA